MGSYSPVFALCISFASFNVWFLRGVAVELLRGRKGFHVPLWRDPEDEVERLFTCGRQRR